MQLVACFSRRKRDAHRAHCKGCVLRWGSDLSEARSQHHCLHRFWSWWVQWRRSDRLVHIDYMMDALGATEEVEGDRGDYLHACFHDEFGFFNERISSDGVTYSGGGEGYSFHWRSVGSRIAMLELGIQLPGWIDGAFCLNWCSLLLLPGLSLLAFYDFSFFITIKPHVFLKKIVGGKSLLQPKNWQQIIFYANVWCD